MSINNLRNNLHYCQETIYICDMSIFDAKRFGEWLKDAFDNSHYKSFAQLAEKVGVTRAYVSNLINAKEQLLTGKASQPNSELVVKLAQALGKDVNEALLLAGHAPIDSKIRKPETPADFIQILDNMGFEIQFDADLSVLTADDLQDLLDMIKANLLVKVERKKQQ
jgi:plasmid maintenance system antidote protein VapI